MKHLSRCESKILIYDMGYIIHILDLRIYNRASKRIREKVNGLRGSQPLSLEIPVVQLVSRKIALVFMRKQ